MERLTRWLLLWPALLALLAGWLYEPLTPRYRALAAAARRGDAAALESGRRDWLRTGAYLPASREVRAGFRPSAGETPAPPGPDR